MNKSVLILDTPKDCGHCLLSDFVDGDNCLCRKADRENNANDKPNWCPLRPLPKKKTVEVEDISDVVNFSSYEMQQKMIIETRLATDKLIALGWNACLDEITGETE